MMTTPWYIRHYLRPAAAPALRELPWQHLFTWQ